MSKCIYLTQYEKGKIDQLKALNWSQRKIAEEIGRSKTVVQQYLSPKDLGRPKSARGRKKLIGPKTTNRLIKLASNKRISVSKLKESVGFTGSYKTVLRVLHNSTTLKFQKMKGKPALTPEHKNQRFNFALNHVTWSEEWKNVVFSDEKKFNLDGPDGFHYYWHDLTKEPITYSKRVQGGGGVMIWIGFCHAGKTSIHFIDNTMNSPGYVHLLNNALIPFAEQVLENNFIFQQDNAPCHRANNTEEWFERKGISVMEWPSRSPDLNPVENLFGLLARKVYEGNKQYHTINQLKSAILISWDEIRNEVLENLVCSMSKRMLEVLKSRGNNIKY